MFRRRIDDNLELRLLGEEDSATLFALADANREHLREWLPKVDMAHDERSVADFIEQTHREYAEGASLKAGIFHDGQLVGMCGFNSIDPVEKTAGMSYWLGSNRQGKGLVTRACMALLDHGFTAMGLQRVDVYCTVENGRSRAVPERLGFAHQAMLPFGEDAAGRPLNVIVYAMLACEWQPVAGAMA